MLFPILKTERGTWGGMWMPSASTCIAHGAALETVFWGFWERGRTYPFIFLYL